MSLVLRIKRQITTYFLSMEPSDTVLELKKKILDLIPGIYFALKIGKKSSEIQLQISKLDKTYTTLEDDHKLEQMGILDDSVIFLTFLEDGKWETVNIPQYAPTEEPAVK